mgnify:CR=1 FL=1
MEYLKTEDERQVLIGTNEEDMVLLCDWYIGLTESVPASEIIKMENLN